MDVVSTQWLWKQISTNFESEEEFQRKKQHIFKDWDTHMVKLEAISNQTTSTDSRIESLYAIKMNQSLWIPMLQIGNMKKRKKQWNILIPIKKVTNLKPENLTSIHIEWLASQSMILSSEKEIKPQCEM